MSLTTQLANTTLHFAKGEVWGILGPNGCGKTTLLHQLAGLGVTQNKVWLHQQSIHSLARKAIAREIGILLQDTQFAFPQTVRDYCAAARFPHLGYWQRQSYADEQIIDTALEQMALTKLAARNVLQLSGGEKRRVAIAALIAQTPQIYLLDEPANHLDLSQQLRILHFFKQQAKLGATVIMSLHDVNHAQQFCDKVMLMSQTDDILYGDTNTILTLENVSQLYQHPMQMIRQAAKVYWLG